MHPFVATFCKMLEASTITSIRKQISDLEYFDSPKEFEKFSPGGPSEGAIYFHLFYKLYHNYREDFRNDLIKLFETFKFSDMRQLIFVIDVFSKLHDESISKSIIDTVIQDKNPHLQKVLTDINYASRTQDLLSLYDLAEDHRKMDVFLFFSETIPSRYPEQFDWLRTSSLGTWATTMLGCHTRGVNFAALVKNADSKVRARIIKAFKTKNPFTLYSQYSRYFERAIAFINFSKIGKVEYEFFLNKIVKHFPDILSGVVKEEDREEISFVRECIRGIKPKDRLVLVPILRRQAGGSLDRYIALTEDWSDIFGKEGAKAEIQKYKNLL